MIAAQREHVLPGYHSPRPRASAGAAQQTALVYSMDGRVSTRRDHPAQALVATVAATGGAPLPGLTGSARTGWSLSAQEAICPCSSN